MGGGGSGEGGYILVKGTKWMLSAERVKKGEVGGCQISEVQRASKLIYYKMLGFEIIILNVSLMYMLPMKVSSKQKLQKQYNRLLNIRLKINWSQQLNVYLLYKPP